jgi:hypothetical protein
MAGQLLSLDREAALIHSTGTERKRNLSVECHHRISRNVQIGKNERRVRSLTVVVPIFFLDHPGWNAKCRLTATVRGIASGLNMVGSADFSDLRRSEALNSPKSD